MMNPYELVNQSNAMKPNYNLSGRQFSFDIYLCHTQEVCIMGRLDSNYICGLSFSTVSDLARTQAIIDGMANGEHTLVSNESKVLGERFYEVDKWYRFWTTARNDNGEILYHFSGNDGYFQQSHMAEQIKSYFVKLINTCEARLADGIYLSVLKHYNKILSRYKRRDPEAPEYYFQNKHLIELVKSEHYLKLSPDAEVRELYNAIYTCAGDLYGAFMDEAR